MALTAGLSIACEARSGGIKTIWLANRDDITSFTLGTTEYSAVTMVATKVFYKFEFEQDTAERRESVTRENGSVSATHEVEFFLPKMSQANRDAIEEIIDASACGVVAIVEDANGVKWVDGYSENFGLFRALKLTSDEAASGQALTDLNGDTIILGSVDNEKSRTFTSTVPV